MLARKLKLKHHLWHRLQSHHFGEIRGSGRCHFWTPYCGINLIRFECRKNTGKSNHRWVTRTQLSNLNIVFLLLVCSRHMPSMFQAYAKHVPSIFQAYSEHMPNICQAYSKHIPSICQAYAKHMRNVCQAYAKHMPSVFQAYAKRNASR